MSATIPELDASHIAHHVRRGVLLDSNLLVVVFVGLWKPSFVGRKVTGGEYCERDLDFLTSLLDRARPWILTPHLLTEADNLLDRIGDPGRMECRRLVARTPPRVKESAPLAIKVVDETAYPRLGLADAAIVRVARKHSCLVLTSDAKLHDELLRRHHTTLYYPFLRRFLRTANQPETGGPTDYFGRGR